MQRPSPEAVTLIDILITEELSRRAPRSPNWQAEAEAMRSLGQQMAKASESLMQTLVDTALELCQAGTTGMSLLETTPDGTEIFRWNALAGTLAHHVGGSNLRNFSPCGVCLEQGVPVLFSHPERYFTYFHEANTPIVEGLVLPLVADSHVFGTIWILSHDEGRHFDSEDVRVMTSLADFTATALLLQQRQTGELLVANVALETEVLERKQAEARSRALISNLPGGAAFVVDRDLRYLLAEGEALATAGFKPEDFMGRTIFEVLPPDLAASYEPLYRQALAGEPFEHEHNAHVREASPQENRTYISRGTPLRADNGEIYAVLAISYDITDRKRVEDERRQVETAVAADLEDMQRLRELSARLVTEDDIQTLYQEIVTTAIALTRADAGTVQILDEATQDFLVLAAQGFEQNMVDQFYRVKPGSNTSCGMALATGDRAFIDFDVPQSEDQSEDPDGSMRLHLEAGYLSAQSTPLTSRSGKTIGMVSTHWRSHYRPTERELRFLDLLARQAADLIEQRQAQIVLRESEEKYRTLFETMDEGFALCQLLRDRDGKVIDYRILEINPAYERHTGTTAAEVVGRLRSEFDPVRNERTLELCARVVDTGESVRFDYFNEGLNRWLNVGLFPRLGDQFAAVFTNITDRKRAEVALRESEAKLAADLVGMQRLYELYARLAETDLEVALDEILAVACEFTKTDRGCIQLVSDDGERLEMFAWRGYADDSPFINHFRYEGFKQGCDVARVERQRFIIEETIGHPGLEGTEAGAVADAEGIRATQSTPMLSHSGDPLGVLSTQFRQPHRPGDDELKLIDLLAWVAADFVERHRALTALRKSEAKYRSLFEAIDAGFCIFEMLYNEAGEAIDFRYIETNPAFERQSGRRPQRGQTMRELFPEAEDMWLKDYAEVARTGQPKRFIDFHETLDRWFDVFVFPTSNGKHQLAALFSDVTDEKRAEAALRASEERQAFLLKLSDAIKPLTDPVEIMAMVSETVGRYYNVGRCGYAEVPPPYDHLVVARDWTNGILQSLQGALPLVSFGDDIIRQYRSGQTVVVEDALEDARNQGKEAGLEAAGNIRSSITVQLIKLGNWVASFYVQDTVRRSWTQNEVDLMEEIAERTWTALKRARAEEAMSESEAKYRSLFESIDEGFAIAEVIYDPAGQPVDILYLEANPAASRLTGIADYTRRRLSEVSPDFEPYWVEIYDRVARSGISERTEQYAAPLDRWFDFYVFPVETIADTSESRRVATIFQDITDRKRSEEKLRRAAETDAFRVKLSDALRPLSDPVQIQAQACRLLGEHLGVSRAYYCEVNPDGTHVTVAANYTNGVPSTVGQYRLDDYSPVFRDNFRVGQNVVIADALNGPFVPEEMRAGWQALGTQACVCVPLVKEGRFVACMTVDQSIPRQWKDDEIELLEEVAERTWAAVERERVETALHESELQRIREQAAREEERQRAESLAELDRAKTIFFSNASHEFRTPLTLLLAPLQDALNDRTLPPVHRERLELAHRNSLRLLKLVNTLLDFSRIEAGRIEAVYEPTDLATYTTELASVFRSAIERAGLQLVVDCPPLPEPVFVDREMWEKIVLNLLSNAFKFTFEGEIRVRLCSADGNQAILQIQDTGTGIAPEHLPHLFERFYQVRGTRARTHEGSGIGLALVHELVRLLGGTIEVSSTLGQGTCFTVSLSFGTEHLPSDRVASPQENRLHDEGAPQSGSVPGRIQPTRTLASTAMGAASYVEEAERWLSSEEHREQTIENTEEQTAQTADSSFPTLTSARVLLVDDNADMREYLTRILSEHVQVEAVADGATALAAAQERVPDLILSDVMMPGLDGFELLEALRAEPCTREVPIILLSARAGEEAIVEGLKAGADDYLIKPFSAQELVSRVTAHLQMAQLRGEALQQERIINRQKDEFISVVSHELNTPLVSILGWTRVLRNNPPSPAMLSKALDTIERNATMQGKLVQDLLDLSRISAGKLRLNPQPIELKPVIETAIATAIQSAADKGIHLTWQANATEPVVVMGDGDRLCQVLINLLTNAIKFIPESGSIRVELSVLNDDASYAEIRVADTGDGISADFLPYVFDRFRQADGANAAKGLGLGLAIARHIVELHNGAIYAESAGEGQGAIFTVRLPLLQNRDDLI